MLAKRIIPSVLVRGKTAFKGPGFGEKCTRSVGSALAICRTHARRGVDELLILDIGATPEGRGPDLELVKQLSDECFIPITVGGGVKTLHDIDALLRSGADKVAIGAAARDPGSSLLRDAADRFGSQAIVAVVEHQRHLPYQPWSASVPQGAGEVVLQCCDTDSTMTGYDLYLASAWAAILDVPLIVSGGCRDAQDMLNAIKLGADGVAVGALFQFTDTTPRDCALYLKSQGIEVRL
jgi:cyclase